jgi:hypothetical protein
MPTGVHNCNCAPNYEDATTEPKSFKIRPRSINLCKNLGELVELIDAKRQALGLTQADLARIASTDQEPTIQSSPI